MIGRVTGVTGVKNFPRKNRPSLCCVGFIADLHRDVGGGVGCYGG